MNFCTNVCNFSSKPSFSLNIIMHELIMQKKISPWEIALQNPRITKLQTFLKNFKNLLQSRYYVWTDNAEKNLPVTGCSTSSNKYKFTNILAKLQNPVSVSILLCLTYNEGESISVRGHSTKLKICKITNILAKLQKPENIKCWFDYKKLTVKPVQVVTNTTFISRAYNVPIFRPFSHL